MPLSHLRADGKTAAGDEHFDWESLVSQTVHPLKVAIIEAIWWIGRPVTANDLFICFGSPGTISVISYHVHVLEKMGVLEAGEVRPVRGSVETFFFFSPTAFRAT